MAIVVECDRCGQRYRLRDDLAGKQARCKCGNLLSLPEATSVSDAALQDLVQQDAEPSDQAPLQPAGMPHTSGFMPPGRHELPLPKGSAGSSKRLRWLMGGLGGVFLLLAVTIVWLLLPARERTPGEPTASSGPVSTSQTTAGSVPRPQDSTAPDKGTPAVPSGTGTLTTSPKTETTSANSGTKLRAGNSRPTVSTPPRETPSSPASGGALKNLRSDSAEEEMARVEKKQDLRFSKVFEIKEEKSNLSVAAIALTTDGGRAVTCTPNGECQAWDVNARKPLAKYEGVKTTGTSKFAVAITPDGKYGLVSGATNAVQVWDTENGKHLFTHDAPKTRVTHIRVTADGKRMACVDSVGVIHNYPTLGGQGWQAETGEAKAFTWFALDSTGQIAAMGPRGKLTAVINRFPSPSNKDGASSTIDFTARVTCISGDISEHWGVFGTNSQQIMLVADIPTERGKFKWAGPIGSRLDQALLVQVVNDGETIAAMDDVGGVEYRHHRHAGTATGCKVDAGEVNGITMSRDGKTVAYGRNDGFAVWRITELPLSHNVRFSMLLERCFLNQEYDKLESIAQVLQKESKPFTWAGLFSRYETMIEELSFQPPAIFHDRAGHDERIKTWLAARPASLTAKLVQAQRLIHLAWEARGSGLANTVTEAGWKGFHTNLEAACKIVLSIVESDNAPAEVYPLIFQVAKGLSWDRARVDAYVEKMMKTAPRQYTAHVRVGELLMPRWGGDRQDSEAYARRIADRVGGAEGDAIYARVAICLRPYHSRDTFLLEHRFDMDRVHKGIAKLAEDAPDDPLPLHEGLILAQMRDDMDRGKAYVAQLAPLDEQWPVHLWRERHLYEAVKAWAQGPQKDGLGTLQPKDKADPTGTWSPARPKLAKAQKRELFKLKLEGQKLSGLHVARDGKESPIVGGRFNEGEVSFKIVREQEGRQSTITYTGKMSDDTIQGTREEKGIGSSSKYDWKVERVKE